MSAEPLLKVRGLKARYGRIEVLHGIDLDVMPGQITALLGANGAGKTTSLRALCQFMVQSSGSIQLAGAEMLGRSTEAIAKMGVGHVPDGRGTFVGLTVEENLRLGSYARASRQGMSEDMARIYDYFPRLKERFKQQAGTLSGGEQQMLAIGRALMGHPRLLLLDEPSFGLAPLVVKDIFAIMRRINAEQNVSILLVEQNARLALNLSSSAYLLETGRVAMSGSSEELKRSDAVRRAYLGE
jgi:branched-chain amino acid transport system ATP-binding protein